MIPDPSRPDGSARAAPSVVLANPAIPFRTHPSSLTTRHRAAHRRVEPRSRADSGGEIRTTGLGGGVSFVAMMLSHDTMLRRFLARDRSADGAFVTGVLTTGIYCLPSCPARKPLPENVRFFPGVEEAREAGLRPCKRCRPNDFYRDYDPDAHLLDVLVAEVRRAPAEFADAAAMAARSGIGGTKLNTLFRRHWHTTPAAFLARERVAAACRLLAESDAALPEIAFAAGWESLSAFHDAFRRQTALTPGEYRRLGTAPGFRLALPDDFRIADTLRVLGRDPLSPAERVDGNRASKALRLAGLPAVLRVTLAAGEAACEVTSPHALPPAAWRQAHEAALRWLGLRDDPAGLVRRLQSRPELLRVVGARPGLRIPKTPDAFEGLCWAIVGQQVNLRFAYELRRTLIDLAGDDAGEGMRAFPPAERLAALDPADLSARRFSRRKAEYVVDTARLVASGELPLEALAAGPATELERRLLAVRGLGPWSAAYFLMRSAGFADCVPVGDSGLTTALQRLHDLPLRPGPDETIALMEPFAPFRSLATFHLWQSLGDPA